MINLKPIKLTISQATEKLPRIDRCRCDTCGAEQSPEEAIDDYGHHDGWEMPPYNQQLCSKCKDGYIDDYWPSNKSLAEAEEFYKSMSPEDRERYFFGEWK